MAKEIPARASGARTPCWTGAGQRADRAPPARRQIGESGGRSRLDQVVEWCGGAGFDGVVALDECHRAKNLDRHGGGSRAALAVRDLQDRLPVARVVYVSATGLTEPEHLACLSRLGLWGLGEPVTAGAALLCVRRGSGGAAGH